MEYKATNFFEQAAIAEEHMKKLVRCYELRLAPSGSDYLVCDNPATTVLRFRAGYTLQMCSHHAEPYVQGGLAEVVGMIEL